MGKHDTTPFCSNWCTRSTSPGGTRPGDRLRARHGGHRRLDRAGGLLRGARGGLNALQPESGPLGKDYAKEVDAESAHHLHVRAGGKDEGLWRISLESVDGWTVSASRDAAADEGPFARLLSR